MLEEHKIYRKLQALLPKYTVESVTMANLSEYEAVFYSNEEYYYLTDGHPATRKDCEDTICLFAAENVHSIGVSRNGKAIAFMSILERYPNTETLYVGLLLVDKKFQRQSVGTMLMKALLSVADDLKFQNLRLSVQSNNISGLTFWKKLRFYEVSRCICNGFDNLSMKYDIGKLW